MFGHTSQAASSFWMAVRVVVLESCDLQPKSIHNYQLVMLQIMGHDCLSFSLRTHGS